MLVLSRKKGESIVLLAGGVEIRVSVHELTSSRIRLGFDAPREVKVVRGELYDRRTSLAPEPVVQP